MEIRKLTRHQLGQGMTEYIIIVIVVAIAAIGVYMYFGQTLRADVAGMAQEMAGQDSSAARTAAQGAASNATTKETGEKGLGNYQSGK